MENLSVRLLDVQDGIRELLNMNMYKHQQNCHAHDKTSITVAWDKSMFRVIRSRSQPLLPPVTPIKFDKFGEVLASIIPVCTALRRNTPYP